MAFEFFNNSAGKSDDSGNLHEFLKDYEKKSCLLFITKTFISVQIGKYFCVCFSWGNNIDNMFL